MVELNDTEANVQSILEALEDAHAMEPIVIDVEGRLDVVARMIVAGARSERHLNAMSEHLKRRDWPEGRPSVEGTAQSQWIMLAFGDIWLHLLTWPAREYYDIEGIWDVDIDDDEGGDKGDGAAAA